MVRGKSKFSTWNYELSLHILKSLAKSFERDSELFQRYDDTIKEQFDKSIIEKIESVEVHNNIRKQYAVITPD